MQTTRSGVCIVRESALVNNFLKRKRREAAYEFGQRIYIKYGNGVETTYNYKKETRLLDAIETKNKSGKHYQNIKYCFNQVGNILGYTNDCLNNGAGGNYVTTQSYTYDDLYQLTGVKGSSEFEKFSNIQTFKGSYEQSYSFDNIGNMTLKKSSDKTNYGVRNGDNLTYELDYEIEKGFAHRYSRIGTRYYKYDEAGNIIVEQEGEIKENDDEEFYKIDTYDDDVYGVNEAWGYGVSDDANNTQTKKKYHREFSWDEKNMLIRSADNNVEVFFVYGEDGKRTNKYTKTDETLYYNNFWSYHRDGSTSGGDGKVIKHIFLGETRLATTINDYNLAKNGSHGDEKKHTYYYHADHLGSASLITDNNGDEYERIEYTPYGETWINIKLQTKTEIAPFNYRFSAKELDKETGFYYYGARYLDPKYSRWISADPAMNTGEYFPIAPIDDNAKKHNQNLPGMGGVFNHINCNLFAYAANNPIKYTDPDGRDVNAPIIFENKIPSECVKQRSDAEYAAFMDEHCEYPIRQVTQQYGFDAIKQIREHIADSVENKVIFNSLSDSKKLKNITHAVNNITKSIDRINKINKTLQQPEIKGALVKSLKYFAKGINIANDIVKNVSTFDKRSQEYGQMAEIFGSYSVQLKAFKERGYNIMSITIDMEIDNFNFIRSVKSATVILTKGDSYSIIKLNNEL